MIDIHSHILPSLDDGANSIQQAIEMAKQAQAQGIYAMAATPHHMNGSFTNVKEDIEQYIKELNQVLNEHSIDLNIVAGQEVRLYGEIVDDYKKGDILTINHSRYVLVELPSDHVPAYTAKIFYDLQLAGVKPIIAHPERNREIAANTNKLYELVEQGALAQLTASSLTGRFGKNIKKLSEQLIDHQLVHFLASDTHNTTSRPNDLQAAYQTMEKTFGMDTVYYIQENAETLLYGDTVYAEPPSRIKKKKFLGIF
ncbi:tyrosine-protein phosphatase [Halalkalibacter nanhaiisediminis]|uniref:Tyrosine-protein phosphatase n=1 Tax=Halalkalibacter nanhaiisediminis TaxID=688079 RepID=A0A562QSY5_9BACI|nr:CpsB/CapC family capsule biosynthesis tyrosine phosphatase [Halalkalibacter nanhaiisediminis]TWI59869.1 protein-tyrosine phosphatase [Halalkalibacter nanhaiisediminis]